jgi:hypothetical protein
MQLQKSGSAEYFVILKFMGTSNWSTPSRELLTSSNTTSEKQFIFHNKKLFTSMRVLFSLLWRDFYLWTRS